MSSDETPEMIATQADAESAPSVLPTGLPESIRFCPELRVLIDRWPTLPEAIRAGIVAMVQSAGATE